MRMFWAFRIPAGSGTLVRAITILIASLGGIQQAEAAPPDSGKWISLFNGKDLEGWTPKIKGYDAGENYAEHLPGRGRRAQGLLRQYPQVRRQVRAPVLQEASSRTIACGSSIGSWATSAPAGPAWAIRNSGVMIHCQSPESMRKDQDFPVSIEVQFLGRRRQGRSGRPATSARPGTNIVMDGKLITQHCTDSTVQDLRRRPVGDGRGRGPRRRHDQAHRRRRDRARVREAATRPQRPRRREAASRTADGCSTRATSPSRPRAIPIEFRKVEILPLKP